MMRLTNPGRCPTIRKHTTRIPNNQSPPYRSWDQTILTTNIQHLGLGTQHHR
jgi:hypothetical protein